MKRTNFFIIILIAVVLLLSNISYSAVVQDKTVRYKDGVTYTWFYGTITIGGTDKCYTQWIYLPEYVEANSYISVVNSNVGGTEDVNVSVQYAPSPDSTLRLSAATAIDDLDQVVTTMLHDTVNVIGGTADPEYQTGRYVRFLFDGMSGHPATSITSWWIKFRKNNVVVPDVGRYIFNDIN